MNLAHNKIHHEIGQLHIVLFQPQIPQNTGNIVRTCSVTNTKLILVRPLGFSITDRWLKRAGLDYWEEVDISVIDSLSPVLEQTEAPVYFFSSKVTKPYTEANCCNGAFLVFGSETTGLPPELFLERKNDFYTIPMIEGARCLNLATSAAIVTYEAYRQTGFAFNQINSSTS